MLYLLLIFFGVAAVAVYLLVVFNEVPGAVSERWGELEDFPRTSESGRPTRLRTGDRRRRAGPRARSADVARRGRGLVRARSPGAPSALPGRQDRRNRERGAGSRIKRRRVKSGN